MKTINASTFLVISLTVIANVHAVPAGITPDVSSTRINTDDNGRGVSSTTTNMNKVGNAASDSISDDELRAFTKTQDSHNDGSNPKAKTTASGDDVLESIVSDGPSTDPTGDSSTALLEDTFTASDDTLAATDFASVSDDPMTWSVSPATMMVLPKPRPPPSPPATVMPLTSTVPHPSNIPPLSTSIGSGSSRMKVISCKGAIIALFVGAIAVFL